jgi:hypothetical protein
MLIGTCGFGIEFFEWIKSYVLSNTSITEDLS